MSQPQNPGDPGAATSDSPVDTAQTSARDPASTIWYESLFNHSLDGTLLADAATLTIVAANPETCRLLGYREPDLVGKSAYMLVDVADPRVAAATEVRARTGRFRGELTGRRADGTLFPIELASTVFSAPDGRRLIAYFFKDISQRKQAEAALAASQSMYRLLAENSSDVVWMLDAEGNLAYMSPNISRLLGDDDGDDDSDDDSALPNRTMTDLLLLIHPDDRLRLAAEAESGSEQHLPASRVEYRLMIRDGSYIWVEDRARREFDEEGRHIRTIVNTREITERKRAELALIESEQALRAANEELEQRVAERTAELRHVVAELERANAGKDAFMAAVSHELRTPLTGIISIADALDSQIRGSLNERQQQYVATIQSSGERLLQVINAVLDYTTVVTDRRPPETKPCLLAELCAAAVALARPKAARKQQTIDVDVEPPDLQIQSNDDTVLRVLDALLDNAVKFTPPHGRLGIRVCRTGSAVQIEVWDSGIGIQEQHKAYLFKPFTQVDQRLSRQYEGIGLGLAIAQRKAELLGGTVSVETTVDHGSRFIVTLPDISSVQ